ncbi:hypothetical protein D3C80_1354060 [compost metagenome]
MLRSFLLLPKEPKTSFFALRYRTFPIPSIQENYSQTYKQKSKHLLLKFPPWPIHKTWCPFLHLHTSGQPSFLRILVHQVVSFLQQEIFDLYPDLLPQVLKRFERNHVQLLLPLVVLLSIRNSSVSQFILYLFRRQMYL